MRRLRTKIKIWRRRSLRRLRGRIASLWSRTSIGLGYARRSLAFLVSAIGIAASALAIYYEYRQSEPSIDPDSGISDQYLDLPITISNKGNIFREINLRMRCEIHEVAWVLPGGQFIRNKEKWVAPASYNAPSLDPGNSISLNCRNADKWGMTIKSMPSGIPTKWYPSYILVKVVIEYRTDVGPLHIERSVVSQFFTWKLGPKGYSWLKGDETSLPSYYRAPPGFPLPLSDYNLQN